MAVFAKRSKRESTFGIIIALDSTRISLSLSATIYNIPYIINICSSFRRFYIECFICPRRRHVEASIGTGSSCSSANQLTEKSRAMVSPRREDDRGVVNFMRNIFCWNPRKEELLRLKMSANATETSPLTHYVSLLNNARSLSTDMCHGWRLPRDKLADSISPAWRDAKWIRADRSTYYITTTTSFSFVGAQSCLPASFFGWRASTSETGFCKWSNNRRESSNDEII